MENKTSYVATSLLSSAGLYFAWHVSAPGRDPVDWTVIGLFLLAVLWNLGNLGTRLYRTGGGRSLWHLQRTLLFWTVGILNTGLAGLRDVGAWGHVVGWLFVVVAALDTYQLHRTERSAQTAGTDGENPAH
jgi:Ni,Fe-hydrogenase I cytochrome b subunit